jgi:tape measure domain-containing protein
MELDSLTVKLLADVAGYTQALDTAQATTQQFASSTASILAQVGLSFSLLGTAIKGVQSAARSEATLVDLEVMLGSADAAKKMIADLVAFSERTPLRMPSLLSATQLLTQVGVTAADVVPLLKMLGDASGGNADRLQRMALAMSRVISSTRVTGREVRQLTMAGFNPMKDIAAVTGKSVAQVNETLRKGGLGADVLIKAFQRADSAGGTFSGRMERASQTLAGLFSTMQDAVSKPIKEIGNILIEGLDLKSVVRNITDGAKMIATALKGLTPGVKNVIAEVLLGTVAFGLLSFGMLALGPIIGVLTGALSVFGLLLTPLGAAIGIAIGLFAVWVDQAGGLPAVWAQVKAAALAAWDWLLPVRQALVSFFDTVRTAGVKAWVWFEDVVVQVWESITASSFVNWDVIRAHIVTAIEGAEWVVANFGEIAGATWDAIKAGAESAATSLATFGGYVRTVWNLTVSWLGDFIRENRTLLFNLAALTAGVLATYQAIQLITFGLGLVQSVMAFLKVEQIASAALWVGWTAAVFAAKAVLFLFNLQMAAWNAVALTATLVEGLWTTGATAATLATWLWNAALAALAAVAAPVELLSMAIAVGGVAAALTLAGAAAWAAYKSIGSVLEALLILPTTTGPLGAIGGLFREWKGLIIDVARAAQNNLPLAWQLAGAGFKLAVAEVQDLWPPLWTFIQSGFAALWDLVTQQFVIRFRQALFTISGHLVDFLTSGPVAAVMPGAALEATVIGPALKAAGQTYNDAANASLKAAQDRLSAAAGMFGVVESAETKAARAEVERLRKLVGTPLEIPQPEVTPQGPTPVPGPDLNKIRQDFALAGNYGGQAMGKALAQQKPLDAALVFSAEGTARLTSYLNMLQGIVPTAGGAGKKGAGLGTMPDTAAAPGQGAVPAIAPVPAPALAPAQASDPFRQAVIAVLTRIAESTEFMAKRPGIELKPAGLK